MYRLVFASCLLATAVPASAEIIVVGGPSSHEVRIMRGGQDRCAGGPVIIRLDEEASTKSARCAVANPVIASNITVNNTIAIVIDRRRKHGYMRHH